jgi:N6-adenosine-specific RNA methylase IME4
VKSAVSSRTLASPSWGLEVFAREVREAWTSVGDECLLFQNRRHMQATAGTEPGLL